MNQIRPHGVALKDSLPKEFCIEGELQESPYCIKGADVGEAPDAGSPRNLPKRTKSAIQRAPVPAANISTFTQLAFFP